MQPGQHRRGDAIGTQRQRLVDGGHTQFSRARGQRRPGDPQRAVPIAVGLDDGHHLRIAGVLAQHPHVVRNGIQVHHGLGKHARCQGYRSHFPAIVPEPSPTVIRRRLVTTATSANPPGQRLL